jgi:hypothetical protein
LILLFEEVPPLIFLAMTLGRMALSAGLFFDDNAVCVPRLPQFIDCVFSSKHSI